ncbi:hypothetical protein DESHY_40207 [Desulforamulus hydrothermalis Lam5 = DSM 18033]|uniref:FAD/NAD(P)-binding domain-containing protein n=1 Tax=Desulforamulus hydrothermalis Lam5 = DSM 18033 TaxID=1121428 RepID=K8DZT1_9FIRM|nr:hypothetical protein DESHY_40207 [Desulforamulus hydrothermalis Lam5 = DSM 18033]
MQAYLNQLIEQVQKHDKIKVYTGVTVADVHGFMGNYESELSNGEKIKHGVAIIATGHENTNRRNTCTGTTAGCTPCWNWKTCWQKAN